MFDLLSTAELTASAAIVVATLTFLFGTSARERTLIAVGLTAWFATVLWLGATESLHYSHGHGVPGLAAAIALPVVVLSAILLGTREGRRRVAAVSLPALIAVQAVRVLGVSFVLLHASGRLPAPFAPIAGWGDILVGALALPVAWATLHSSTHSSAVVRLWNVLGTADLVAAIGLGATSSPGPIQIFTQEPGSALMTSVPWIIIPCFLVPALLTLHLVIFYRLNARPDAVKHAQAGGRHWRSVRVG